MTSRRTVVNLMAIAAASGVLLLYAFTQLLVGALYDTTYPVSVRLPVSGGLLAQQEVTLSGRVIGSVAGVELDDDAVLVHLAIHEDERIPADVDVTVLRRSPVGEQAIDFRPATGGEPFLEPGDVVDALEATTPVPVQRLLEMANEVFDPVDAEATGLLFGELADAVRGRRDDIRGLIADSATFSEAVAAGEADVERFFSASRRVNAVLAANRATLARSISEMADAAEILVRMRTDFQGLLAEAPSTLDTVTTMVERSQPNLSCGIRSIGTLNTHLARPDGLRDLEEALRLNRWFFIGFELGAVADHEDRVWNRIQFVAPQDSAPDSYLPDKRPIPDILPGGACHYEPFGTGAPAAQQAVFSPVTEENEIVPPEHATASAGPTTPLASRDTQTSGGGTGVAVLFAAVLLGTVGRRLQRRSGHRP